MITIDADGPVYVAYGGTWREPDDCKRAKGKTQGDALLAYLQSNECGINDTVAWDTHYIDGVVAWQRQCSVVEALQQRGIEITPALFHRSNATQWSVTAMNPPRAFCYR